MALEIGNPPDEPDRRMVCIIILGNTTTPEYLEIPTHFKLFMSHRLFFRLYPDGQYKTGLENGQSRA